MEMVTKEHLDNVSSANATQPPTQKNPKNITSPPTPPPPQKKKKRTTLSLVGN